MKKAIFLSILFLAGTVSVFSQITFKGTAPGAVVSGEQFRVNYTLTTAGEKGKDIRLPETGDLKVLYGPTLSGQSSSTSIVNGNVSTQAYFTYTFVLLAEKEGEFTIPQATIKVGNSEYKSNELKVKVLPQDQAAEAASANRQAEQQQNSPSGSAQALSNEEVFIRMHVSKSSVYENEGFLVTFKLYSLVDVLGFENVKFPEFEGFIAQEIDLPEDKQLNLENYRGRNYRTVVLKQVILYPQRSGKITIPSGKFDTNIRMRAQAQRQRSFFDDFFDAYTNVKKTLISSPATIDVKPLPAGKPASFSGAVGDYRLASSISATRMKANEPVTIKISISGTGNIKMLKNPELVFPNDFEIYDPKVDVNAKASASGVSGTKTIEYYAVPRYAGDFTIPSVRFSYFDLKTKAYKTHSTEPWHLQVEPGAGGTAPAATIVNATNKEDVRFVGQDIRHIKTGGFRFRNDGFFFGTWRYGLSYLVPALLFAVFFLIYRKQVKENANLALVRTRKANKVASKRLKQANRYLKENKREAFYDETLKAVWGYLSDKLTIPVSGLTKDNVEAELIAYGVAEELIRQFITILNTAEFARFAPSQPEGAMDDLYHSTVNAINQMEKI
ncbi:MAG: BatD family protein [Dysgonamonadaceae bacterium]|nr:BatD family protein [Dysgonamonadaceae bacterium]